LPSSYLPFSGVYLPCGSSRGVTNSAHLLNSSGELTVPTLIIHGDYDHIPVEYAAHITEAIPGARFALLRDCGHLSYLECPDEVRKEIIDFLL
jgi:pimeloyl-ACP methyl ester carboxylesterase